MNTNTLYSYIDYTLLNPLATLEDIDNLCKKAIETNCATICIPPCYIHYVHNFYPTLSICTVVGFPLGYSETTVKLLEAREAIAEGANEIDMVVNIGMVKHGNYNYILREINHIKKAIGEHILKVIIETCYLTNEEIAKVTQIVDESNADYVKTSTGFGIHGATFEDIEIIKKNISNNTKIKASGGIRTKKEMEEYISMGCDRIGASKLP